MKKSRIEFYVTPDGRVMYELDDKETKLYEEGDIELSEYMLTLIDRQYPEALDVLSKKYHASKLNKLHYDYLRVSRFIRCNFGNFDGLTYDVKDEVLNIEEVQCPIKCECELYGIICKPKKFGLTEREKQIAKMLSSGMTYDEVSIRLKISSKTVDNTMQKIRKKLKLSSAKDIVKMFVTIL